MSERDWLIVSTPERTSADSYIRAVCGITGVERAELLSAQRYADVVRARWLAIRMLYYETRLTSGQIARKLRRDPSTVHQTLKKADELMRTDSEFAALYRRIRIGQGVSVKEAA